MSSLRENSYYHIYNRGIQSEYLFLKAKHYRHFLNWYWFYLYPVAETFAYVLMKNHFHFLIKIRSKKDQVRLFKKYQRIHEKFPNHWIPYGIKFGKFKYLHPSRQFAHLFNRYTKNFNNWNKREGKLFDSPFKRIRIDNNFYLTNLICYIHRNPLHHGLTEKYNSYPYSSYNIILSEQTTLLQRRQVLSHFGGKSNFLKAHRKMSVKIFDKYSLESPNLSASDNRRT